MKSAMVYERVDEVVSIVLKVLGGLLCVMNAVQSVTYTKPQDVSFSKLGNKH